MKTWELFDTTTEMDSINTVENNGQKWVKTIQFKLVNFERIDFCLHPEIVYQKQLTLTDVTADVEHNEMVSRLTTPGFECSVHTNSKIR